MLKPKPVGTLDQAVALRLQARKHESGVIWTRPSLVTRIVRWVKALDSTPDMRWSMRDACTGSCDRNQGRGLCDCTSDVPLAEPKSASNELPLWVYAAAVAVGCIGSVFYPWGFA